MNIVKINDKDYPELLKQIGKPAPKQLYYKGNWPLDKAQGENNIFDNCLAVVGSRRMTTYGKQITEKLVTQLAVNGITIVSGFMYGIDATAHKTAVDVGGRTIAVMPCGIDRIHPEYQVKLYNDILENKGLIISEYERDTMPGYWTYPARNRIVAGLSKAVLVVEAGEKSGSLITANLAKKFKRKIFAVPGPLTSVLSFGTTQLIKKGEAEIVTDAKDILKYFELDRGPSSEKAEQLKIEDGPIENQIIQLLQTEPMQIDFLARNLNKTIQEVGKTISLMEIKGQIHKENNKYYVF